MRNYIETLNDKVEDKPVSREVLSPEGDTASEYYDVEDRVKKYIQPGHNWFPIVSKIEKVHNTQQEIKWLEMKLKVNDHKHVERKFHGTTKAAMESIIEEGFRVPATKGQMFGAGIYFASDSSKSAQEMYTEGSGILLLCDVLLGKTKTVESARQDMTREKLEHEGYDSLFAKRGSKAKGSVLYDEFVVYNPDQAIVRYLIHYEKAAIHGQLGKLEQAAVDELKAGRIKHYNIKSKREFSLEDPLEVHFRIAESQILRLLEDKMQVDSVDYYINPLLMTKFNKKEEEFQQKYGTSKEARCILCFHGTKPVNIRGIVSTNFSLDKLSANTGDKGYYGAGIYFF